MRVRSAGKIADRLWYLGREEAGVYVLEGDNSSIIINGGLSFILPDVLQQMKDLGINTGKITKLLILHSHFDHVGIVPYFRRTWKIDVLACARAWDILGMPKAVETMNSFNRTAAKQANAAAGLDVFDLDWRDDVSGETVKEGDKIDLGGRVLQIMETPGHSSCSISAYEPGLKAMFASDAGGIPYKNTSFPSGNSDFTLFQKNLERLNKFPVDYLCADHYGYVTGEEARRFIGSTIDEARKLREEMKQILGKEQGNLDSAARACNSLFFQRSPDYFVSPDIMEGVFKQMLKHIAK
ncbi:MAG: MBL fold metallo-hydrolase [Syntrophales bacterium]|jgi:glyoxylase-like metal-dependent hydrolase (beta-lactamase superfamily II)|nr:MBL fold metallo-hydrolase [Syntrophales bacterium]MDD5233698.1 MBL fold metallo-hydrolase [Syntrophales bacterium]MDD5532909.1 MBL fold metallo-hydrolase [Syntrophales bacterium]HPL63544.1 MBL fold metallo-hydrolase [Syntrophales bacterium]